MCVCLCESACEMCGHAPLSLLVTVCSAACVFPALEPFPALLSPQLRGEPAAASSHPDPTHTGEPSHMVYMNTLHTAQRYTHSCTMHKQTHTYSHVYVYYALYITRLNLYTTQIPNIYIHTHTHMSTHADTHMNTIHST